MYFEMKHAIFPVRKTCKLTLKSVFPVRVDPKECYEITFSPFSGLRKYGLRNTGYIPTAQDEAFFAQRHALIPQEDTLWLNVFFPQEDCYICLGDNTYEYERILPEQLIGLVTAFKRRERRISVESPAYQCYARMWVALFPVRRFWKKSILQLRIWLRPLKAWLRRHLS